jgi:cob(I)alamin adenosyltransferase
MEAALPSLAGFVLPGGHPSAARAHVARTVCRRAERHVVRLCDSLDENPATEQMRRIITYLNRLSDYLFTLARACNQLTGTEEKIWKP